MTLLSKMDELRGEPSHPNIQSAMLQWLNGIHKVQARRKEEIVNAANRHRSGAQKYHEERG